VIHCDVDTIPGSSHHVQVGSAADVSEEHTGFIFRLKQTAQISGHISLFSVAKSPRQALISFHHGSGGLLTHITRIHNE
jgi:hypothetical protein